jgi:hypothetical protein
MGVPLIRDCGRRLSGTEASGPSTMRLRYGVNEAHGWREFAQGAHRDAIRERLVALDTQLVGLSVFDTWGPHPIREWPAFAAGVAAVLAADAIPVITFSRLSPPFDEALRLRWFANRCAEVVWSCLERWGERVLDWHWCIGTLPNSDWVNPGLTFDRYRRIYEETAAAILRWLPGRPDGPARIGGPGVDTFQRFWFDWVWRFANEIDPALVGLLTWHHFGDWRAPGEWGAPKTDATYGRLVMSRTSEYGDRAGAVASALAGRRVSSVCSRLGVHAHHEVSVSRRFNQTLYGAAYYASALLQLARAGVDGELFWMGTDPGGPYGLWDEEGRPTPVFQAKRLVTRHLRYGDTLERPPAPRSLDSVIARHPTGRRSILIVHREADSDRFAPGDFLDDSDIETVLTLDETTVGAPVIRRYGGSVAFAGYGVAALSDDGSVD